LSCLVYYVKLTTVMDYQSKARLFFALSDFSFVDFPSVL